MAFLCGLCGLGSGAESRSSSHGPAQQLGASSVQKKEVQDGAFSLTSNSSSLGAGLPVSVTPTVPSKEGRNENKAANEVYTEKRDSLKDEGSLLSTAQTLNHVRGSNNASTKGADDVSGNSGTLVGLKSSMQAAGRAPSATSASAATISPGDALQAAATVPLSDSCDHSTKPASSSSPAAAAAAVAGAPAGAAAGAAGDAASSQPLSVGPPSERGLLKALESGSFVKNPVRAMDLGPSGLARAYVSPSPRASLDRGVTAPAKVSDLLGSKGSPLGTAASHEEPEPVSHRAMGWAG